MSVLSYHNDPAIKAAHIAQAERHLAADMLRAGTYGDTEDGTFRGCSVGCFAHDYGITGNLHAGLANRVGWPEWLVKLSDSMFEGLPAGERGQFHIDLRKRVPVGFDLTPVLNGIAIARMDRLIAAQEAAPRADYADAVLSALRLAREYHANPTESAWSAARSAAWSAWSAAESAAWSAAWSAARSARSAAWSAARSAAESAAWSAAWSARSAAWSAAWSAARSAAWSAAWSAARSAAWSAARSAAESAAWSAAWRAERDALYAELDRMEQQP